MPSLAFDEVSSIWLQPFSALINCMFPVEYVYGDWIGWQTNTEARHADPQSLINEPRCKVAGSLAEGFCIPQFIHRNSDIDSINVWDVKEHWQPDHDLMTENDPFVENDEKELIPIFSVEHTDDPRYAKLKLTKEWKDQHPRFKNVTYLHHSFLLPPASHHLDGQKEQTFDGQTVDWSFRLHGPVRTIQSGGYPSYEEDRTGVFRYPIAWPEPGIEWLVRPHPSGWPSPDLVQEIFDSGCHLAPAGRGKRLDEPVDMLSYCQNPGETMDSLTVLPVDNNEGHWFMEGTEWKVSFAVAENKLGESVSPVQRHIMVLLKMIKKVYFPSIISTYFLKQLLFWECEGKGEVFWKEENSASCLLLMLDRLKECLEAYHLPHFILPESNLLRYEDRSKLNEAAVIVSEVRRNILPKTFTLLRRLQSLTYLSTTYLQNTGIELENHLLKIQEKNLPEDDHRELVMALHSYFVRKCKVVMARLLRIKSTKRKDIENTINIGLFAYQSILARNLCKLWFLDKECNKSNDRNVSGEQFKSFVKGEVEDLSFNEEFFALPLVFFDLAWNGNEPSLAIPSTNVMSLLREEQMKEAHENVTQVQESLKGVFDCLKRSDSNSGSDSGSGSGSGSDSDSD